MYNWCMLYSLEVLTLLPGDIRLVPWRLWLKHPLIITQVCFLLSDVYRKHDTEWQSWWNNGTKVYNFMHWILSENHLLFDRWMESSWLKSQRAKDRIVLSAQWGDWPGMNSPGSPSKIVQLFSWFYLNSTVTMTIVRWEMRALHAAHVCRSME